MEEFQIQDNQLIRYLGHAQNVIIPKGISFIGTEAFRDCSEITSVFVPITSRKSASALLKPAQR